MFSLVSIGGGKREREREREREKTKRKRIYRKQNITQCK
jgi:hypothetical protein